MMLDAGFPRGALNYWKSNFMMELSDQAIDTLISQFAACPSPMSGLVLEHMHDAATRVGVDETAFPHRREGYNLLVVSEWLNPNDNARNIAWARESYDVYASQLHVGALCKLSRRRRRRRRRRGSLWAESPAAANAESEV